MEIFQTNEQIGTENERILLQQITQEERKLRDLTDIVGQLQTQGQIIGAIQKPFQKLIVQNLKSYYNMFLQINQNKPNQQESKNLFISFQDNLKNLFLRAQRQFQKYSVEKWVIMCSKLKHQCQNLIYRNNKFEIRNLLKIEIEDLQLQYDSQQEWFDADCQKIKNYTQ